MNTRKLLCIGIIWTLLSGLSGCVNKSSEPNKKEQINSSQAQSGKTGQTDDSSQNKDQSKSLTPAPNTPSQTQQEVLNKISAALNTKVPLRLPKSVPVGAGSYLTATTTSNTWYYKVNYYETKQIENINSKTASKGSLIATVEGTEYKDADGAKEAISGYMQVDTSKPEAPNIDLGHNIKALGDAGLGHGYLIWNEGRWCINLDSPNDKTYKNEKYPDSKQLAENIVAYLDAHMLPAPQNIGVISINNWNNSNGTSIEWQYGQMVYKVWSQDPFTALKAAVTMK